MNRRAAAIALGVLAFVFARSDAGGEESLDQRIERLIQELGGTDWDGREMASEELAALGVLAEGALLDAATAHEDLEVRIRAQRVLASFTATNREYLRSFLVLGIDELARRFAEVVDRGEPDECALVAEILGEVDAGPAVDLLERLSEHRSNLVRSRSATALGYHSSESSLVLLRRLPGRAGGQSMDDVVYEALARRGEPEALLWARSWLLSSKRGHRTRAILVFTHHYSAPGREDELAEFVRFFAKQVTAESSTPNALFAARFGLALFARAPSARGAELLEALAADASLCALLGEEARLTLGLPAFERFARPGAGR